MQTENFLYGMRSGLIVQKQWKSSSPDIASLASTAIRLSFRAAVQASYNPPMSAGIDRLNHISKKSGTVGWWMGNTPIQPQEEWENLKTRYVTHSQSLKKKCMYVYRLTAANLPTNVLLFSSRCPSRRGSIIVNVYFKSMIIVHVSTESRLFL